ncbi:MAG: hypothetical protein U9Q04_04310 [Campylobacterota bacterium]|nr:hypothetical protein [Campylobacterota bacterium]
MTKLILSSLVLAVSLNAAADCGTQNLEEKPFYKFIKEFGVLNVNQGYKKTNKAMKRRAKKLGYYASTDEVTNALADKKEAGTIVIDTRTKAEQEGLYLKGALKANLRGWNAAFNDMKSTDIKSVYSYCRTGTDQAAGIVNLQFLFQGKAKIFGIADMAKACYPMYSKSGKVLDAKLNAKKVYVQQADDGAYYEVNCPAVKDAYTPIEVYGKSDIELAIEMDEPLPSKMTVKNGKLKKEVTLFKGPDNKYYKKH